jgi:hypothetical protein
MDIIASQNRIVHLLLNILAWTWFSTSLITTASSLFIPKRYYPVLESKYPRFANALRACRAIGSHSEKFLKALWATVTGKAWQTGLIGVVSQAVEGEKPADPPPPAA